MFTCPSCEQTINSASEVCPYCGANLAPEPVATRRKAQRKGLLWTLVGAALVIGAVWAMVWLVLPKPDVPDHAEAEAGAISALRQVVKIVAAYDKEQGTYPNTIQEVSGQASAVYSGAHTEGYSLVYLPGPAGSDGNIHAFVMLARPEYYGYRNFYVDQTGVIRSTKQNREATIRDRPIS
ncbi:MAG TPA: hypothetical protein VNJ12_02985 [Candidatus Dormibacteraeota bacterium]|nr:hypothetical protein [Candidatus Dormibacteraeota bacterium]